MWISVGEGKSRDVAYVSRPRPTDGSGVITFKVPNTKAGQWYRSRVSKLPQVRAAPPKVKPPISKAPTVTKVAQPTKVESKEEKDQNLVQEAGDEPHKILSELRVEEDQVMADAEANVVEKEVEHTAEEEAKEPLENLEGSAAEDKELFGDDEEYADDEYLEDLSEEAMEHLGKEHNEEMAKFENELKVGKVKVKFGDFDEVKAMVITLPLFFEARPDQPNFMAEMCSMRLSPWSKWKGLKKLRWPEKFQRKGMPNLASW
ncbi:hypothetical protein L3X38_036774 [Prunus dulcis]|uniref:Uncharacterized protein n=1 Tax=Prunus dulcis TaxID=3755 RepID=A0AAD4V3V1_PRUDU|nr:hypothetical protein L3X38_036774 [Prunus dulcis]